VKITLGEGSEVLHVEDDYVIDLEDDARWLVIDKEDGGQFIIPAHLITAIMVEGSGS